jgi:hypothetical protein
MNNKNSTLPVVCPSCSSRLAVQSLICPDCDTTVSGLYDLPELLSLSKEELTFIFQFVRNSGSLKEMSKVMGLSYPTIRNYLNDLIEKLDQLDHETG